MAKNKNTRKPKQKIDINLTKQPKNSYSQIPEGRVQLTFAIFDQDFVICDENCKHSIFYKIGNHLKDLEHRYWTDIRNNMDRDHPVSFDSIDQRAFDRLYEIDQDDSEGSLWSFHFSGSEIIWGIKDRNYLKVLWWDPDHKVCPRNTN